jgi:hypothetical protein
MSNTTITPVTISATSILNSSPTMATGCNSTWTNIPYTIGAAVSSAWPQTTSAINSDGCIELKGSNADVVVNGKSILKTICAIEERLALLEPNPNLEKEWEELKNLGDRYRQLEAEIKEKTKMWSVLSNT